MSAPGTGFDVVIEAACRGDSRAFEQLYTRLNRRVHAYVRVRGVDDPEGTVNEVFLAVFTRLGSFSGTEDQFLAWVFTIARNKVIDEARRKQRRVAEVGSVDDSVNAGLVGEPSRSDVERETLTRIDNEALLQKLDVLTEDQRDAVVLRVIGDLSIDMIADVLGKSPGAVKALLRRAFRTIARTGLIVAVPR